MNYQKNGINELMPISKSPLLKTEGHCHEDIRSSRPGINGPAVVNKLNDQSE
jgi:hypothetical protein